MAIARKSNPLRVGAFKTGPGHEQAASRVQDWTRAHFSLPGDAPVMVTELECKRPGCPPLETMVAFWLAEDQRRHFRVFKPISAVVATDLPPVWLKDVLCAEPDDEFGCC